MRKRSCAAMIVSGVLFLAGCGAPGNPEAEQGAVAAAQSWLALVDGGKYAESWEDAAGLFKAAVTKEAWHGKMVAFRQPFGANLSRSVQKTRYHTSLPGAPDGQYVVIQFKSSFEKKKSAMETLTPLLEEDGNWRVSGYYIK